MTNKTYDFWKKIQRYVLPGLGSLYFGIAQLWKLPYGEEVVGTIALITTFLGTILAVASAKFNKEGLDGTLEIDTSDPEKDIYRLDMNGDFDDLKDKSIVYLKVDPNAKLDSQK